MKELSKLVEEALEISHRITMDEKIVSKKKLRRDLKKKQQQKSQDNNKKQNKVQYEVILIDEKDLPSIEQPQTQYTEAYLKILDIFQAMYDKCQKGLKQGDDLWKQSNEDGAVTQEVLNIYNTSINTFYTELENFIKNTYPQYVDQLTEPEINCIEQQVTVAEAAIEKTRQMVLGLNPEQIEQKTGTDIVTTGSTDIIKTSTALVPTTGTSLVPLTQEQPKKLQKFRAKIDDKRRKRKIIDYKNWQKQRKSIWDNLYSLGKFIEKLKNLPITDFLKSAGKLISDNFIASITSPLGKDIVKTFMYANPLTAMIFDGDFGKLNFSALKRPKKDKDRKGIIRDKNGLPNNVEKASAKDMRSEFLSNKRFIKLINKLYNTTDVEIKDKAQLKKLSQDMMELCKEKNLPANKITNTYVALVKLVNKIVLYLGWDEKTLSTFLHKWMTEKGNTTKEEIKIKKAIKNKTKQPQQVTANDVNNMSDDAVKALAARMNKLNAAQESYYDPTNLIKLVESAEA